MINATSRGFRFAAPRSVWAIDCTRLLRGGATIRQVADVTGLKPQTVEKFWLRWVVLPENERLRARVAELESELAALREGT